MNTRVREMARRTSRGFTLVELMVSLVAGLIVTIAVVGLARTATTSFYEEARLSTTEAAVRSAAERLRQDLTRVSYMSTGNIKLAGGDTVPAGLKAAQIVATASPSRYGALTNDLQGIRILVGGSLATAQGPNNLSTKNALNPDAILLTGNFTTDDSYPGQMVNFNTGVELTVADNPAVARLIAGPDPDKAVRNAFTPGSQTGTLPPFLARVVDQRGCQYFVKLASAVGTATKVSLSFAPAADGYPPIPERGTAAGSAKAPCGFPLDSKEEVRVNPVQTVRWSIGPTTTPLAPDVAVGETGNKFDLYREILDASGASVPSPGGPQVVAEYAIDLKFGISVDSPAAAPPPPGNQLTFDMDTPADAVPIADWTQAASGTAAGGPAPQRVRSVRFRVATRSSLPDREAPLSIVPGYISRYCTDSAAVCKKFARARTIMSEVQLINQAGMTY